MELDVALADAAIEVSEARALARLDDAVLDRRAAKLDGLEQPGELHRRHGRGSRWRTNQSRDTDVTCSSASPR